MRKIELGRSAGSVGFLFRYGPHHAVGVRFGLPYLQFRAEKMGTFRFAQGLGIDLWKDTTPPQTVGERGAW